MKTKIKVGIFLALASLYLVSAAILYSQPLKKALQTSLLTLVAQSVQKIPEAKLAIFERPKKIQKTILKELPIESFRAGEVPRYFITVAPENLNWINSLIQYNIDKNNFVLQAQYKEEIPGFMQIDGKAYSILLRYRGDYPINWSGERKSMTIEFVDEYPLGYKKMALILPDDKRWIVEDLVSYRAKKLGVLAPETQFVSVVLNGVEKGLYLSSAGVDSTFLAHSESSEAGDIFKGDLEVYSTQKQTLNGEKIPEQNLLIDLFRNLAFWDKHNKFERNGFSDSAPLYEMTKLSHLDPNYANKRIWALFDREYFIKGQVIRLLVKAVHRDRFHNWKIYFDPTLGKLKQIPWDVSGDILTQARTYSLRNILQAGHNDVSAVAYRDPQFFHDVMVSLWSYLQNDINDDYEYYDKVLLKLQSSLSLEQKISIERYKKFLVEIENGIKKELSENSVETEVRYVSSNSYVLRIIPRNLSGLIVNKIYGIDSAQYNDNILYNSDVAHFMSNVKYDFSVQPAYEFIVRGYPTAIEFKNAVTGEIFIQNPDVKNISRHGFLDEKFSMFEYDDVSNTYILPTGEYEVEEDIRISNSDRVIIKAGVKLHLKKDVSIFVYGKLDILGTLKDPVIIDRADVKDPWGALVYIDADAKRSKIKNLILDGGSWEVSAPVRFLSEKSFPNLFFAMGVLAFHNVEIDVSNIKIKNSFKEEFRYDMRKYATVIEHMLTGSSYKHFEVMQDSDLPLKLESFDIKYSRGVPGRDTKNIRLFFDQNNNGVYDYREKEIPIILKDQNGYKAHFEVDSQHVMVDANLQSVTSEDDFAVDTIVTPWSYSFILDTGEIGSDTISSFKLNLKDINGGTPQVTHLYVDDQIFKNSEDLFASKSEFLARHTIFKLRDGEVTVPKGDYSILEDIIIPYDLPVRIDPATKMRFAPGVSLISYSPIFAEGTSLRPISFEKLSKDPWGVVGLIGEHTSGSKFVNTVFDGGSETYRNGAFISGMLSAYGGDIVVEKSTFKNAAADDALNFKNSNSIVRDSIFKNNSADAIDFDFMRGEIIGNVFEDNGNDGVDTSGSTSRIFDNIVRRSKDKCFSFGEGSLPVVINNLLEGCTIGIASKDSSNPLIINNEIRGNAMGINAYQKKEHFQSSFAEVWNTKFVNNKEDVVLKNVFDGVNLPTDESHVNVHTQINKKILNLNYSRMLDRVSFGLLK